MLVCQGRKVLLWATVVCPLLKNWGGEEGAGGAAALPIIKWKYLDECTVDFRLRLEDLDKALRGAAAPGAAAARPPLLRVPLQVAIGGGGRDAERDVCACALTAAQAEGLATTDSHRP